MRIMVAMGAVAILVLGVVPATAAIWSQDMEAAFSAVTNDRDDRNEGSTNEAPWNASTNGFLSGSIAGGFYASQPDWNQGTWAMSQSSYASQGSSSMKMVPNTGGLRDIWLGIKISGLTPGQTYTIKFDMAMNKSALVEGGGNPGAQTGADHVTSISYNLRNTVENTLETISGKGLMSPAGFADCEDFPSHERNSVWLGNPALWDGSSIQSPIHLRRTARTSMATWRWLSRFGRTMRRIPGQDSSSTTSS